MILSLAGDTNVFVHQKKKRKAFSPSHSRCRFDRISQLLLFVSGTPLIPTPKTRTIKWRCSPHKIEVFAIQQFCLPMVEFAESLYQRTGFRLNDEALPVPVQYQRQRQYKFDLLLLRDNARASAAKRWTTNPSASSVAQDGTVASMPIPTGHNCLERRTVRIRGSPPAWPWESISSQYGK